MALFKRIYNEGYIEFNARTQTEIKALPQRTLVFNLINHIPVVGARKIFPHVAAAELAWTLSGTQDTTFIKEYSKSTNIMKKLWKRSPQVTIFLLRSS